MAGDASVPFSFPEVGDVSFSRDNGRLRSQSREFQTYNAGGVARDVAEDDDEGFLAAQRRTFEEGACARRLEESEEQIPPETSHAEANEAVMVQLFVYPHEDPLWKQLLWCSCLRIHNEAVMVQLLRRLSRLV